MSTHSHTVPHSRSYALHEGLLAITDSIRSMPVLLAHIPAVLAKWQTRATQRSHLATLDERLLRDMGLSQTQALEEIAKPFWRP